MTVVLNGSTVSLDGLLGFSRLQELLKLIISLLNDQGVTLQQLQKDSETSKSFVDKSLQEIRQEAKDEHNSVEKSLEAVRHEAKDQRGRVDKCLGTLEKQAGTLEKQAEIQDAMGTRLGAVEEQVKLLDKLSGDLDMLEERCSSIGERHNALEATQRKCHTELEASQEAQSRKSSTIEAALSNTSDALQQRIEELRNALAAAQQSWEERLSSEVGTAIAPAQASITSAEGRITVLEEWRQQSTVLQQGGSRPSTQRLGRVDTRGSSASLGEQAGMGGAGAGHAGGGRLATQRTGTGLLGDSHGGGPLAGAADQAGSSGHGAGHPGGARLSAQRSGTALLGDGDAHGGSLASAADQAGGGGAGAAQSGGGAAGSEALEHRLGALERAVEGLSAALFGPGGAGGGGASAGRGASNTPSAGSAGTRGSRRPTSSAGVAGEQGRDSKKGSAKPGQGPPPGAGDQSGGSGPAGADAAKDRPKKQFLGEEEPRPGFDTGLSSADINAASRRLEGQVSHLDSLLQELRGSTVTLQGMNDERASNAEEAIRKLEAELKKLSELACGRLRTDLDAVKEREAADMRRLSHEIKELHGHILHLQNAGASATARCLSCFKHRYQEENKILLGLDGKVYQRRPVTPKGNRAPAYAEAWQGAAGPSMRRVRGSMGGSKASSASAPDVVVREALGSLAPQSGHHLHERPLAEDNFEGLDPESVCVSATA